MATDTTATSFANLQGDFKINYAPKIEVLVPEFAVLQKKETGLDWRSQDRNATGASYNVPLVLQDPQGFSYLGTTGVAQDLQPAQPMDVQQAAVIGSEINERIKLSNKALMASTPAGIKAFEQSAILAMKRMTSVTKNRVEGMALYGQSTGGMGTITGSVTNTTGSYWTFAISAATWSAAWWLTNIGANIEFFATGGQTQRGSVYAKVTAVDVATRTLTVLASASLSSAGVTATDVIFMKGANLGSGSYNEMCGLSVQFSNTTSTLFSLSRTTYSQLAGNPYNAGSAAISKDMIVTASTLAVNRGATGEMICLVPSSSWTTLWSKDAALNRKDYSYSPKKSETGSEEIVYASLTGQIKVIYHPFVKEGDFFLFPVEDVIWTGASQPTFNIPGRGEDQFFFTDQDQNSVQIRMIGDLAIFAVYPGHCVFGTGVVNS